MGMHLVLDDFKDGYDQFHKGETRHIPDAKAREFALLGWVLVDGVTPDPQTGGTLTLDIHNGRHGHSSEIR